MCRHSGSSSRNACGRDRLRFRRSSHWRRRIERVRDALVLARGTSQSLVKETSRIGLRARNASAIHAVIGGEIKIIIARDVEIGIGIEAVDKSCLMRR